MNLLQTRHLTRSRSLLLLANLFVFSALAQAPAAAPSTPAPAPPAAAIPEPTPATAPAAALKSAKPLPVIPIQPAPAGFNVPQRSKQILDHLSSVIRYYRLALAPTQKVGEPSDALYRDEALTNSRDIASFAFQSGRAEATLLAAYQAQQNGVTTAPSTQSEASRLLTARNNVEQRLTSLKAQQKTLQTQIDSASPAALQSLRNQQQQVEGALELNIAMSDALGRIVGMSDTQGHSGLVGDVDRLERTAPELTDTKAKVVPTPLESLSTARSAGVSSQATVVFQLLSTRNQINQWIQATDALHQQALDLRTPLTTIVRSTIQKGNDLSQQQAAAAPAAATTSANKAAAAAALATEDAAQLAGTRAQFDSVTATFKVLSAAAIPLSQEIITLEQSRANLIAWRTAVDAEYRLVLRSLLARLFVIAVALGIIFAAGEIWRRATLRYVHDPRRRRQFLGMRRVVTGFLSGLVVVFGFVTQFNSLATFAGFITAGLAVGLQTILLSVAAYFFIIGRYGVRVGDRITVAGVTGDVIEVGLVRFYVMELALSGLEQLPTGRVAVFSNAILFQAGTPLYKQMPGTDYVWYEITARLLQTADLKAGTDAIVNEVQNVYNGYRARIEQQHQALESGTDTQIGSPAVESRLQLIDGGLQFIVRFPVNIRETSEIVGQLTQGMLQLLNTDEAVKKSVDGQPMIKSASRT